MLSEELIKELSESMSVDRLCLVGLFIRLPIVKTELTPEIKLHRAVLDRALIDTFHYKEDIRLDAERWLSKKNQFFLDACERADLDSDLVYTVFTELKKILKGDNAKFRNFKQP